MVKFEYEVFYGSYDESKGEEHVVEEYNEIGQLGWEIVHIREEVSQRPFRLQQWLTCKRRIDQ